MLCALSTLVRSGETTFAESVVDANGSKAVIAAMETHPNHANLQKRACQFLQALSTHDDDDDADYRENIIAANGLVAVAQARQVNHDKNELLVAAEKAIKALIP